MKILCEMPAYQDKVWLLVRLNNDNFAYGIRSDNNIGLAIHTNGTKLHVISALERNIRLCDMLLESNQVSNSQLTVVYMNERKMAEVFLDKLRDLS